MRKAASRHAHLLAETTVGVEIVPDATRFVDGDEMRETQ